MSLEPEAALAGLRMLGERILQAGSALALLARTPQPPTGPHIRGSPVRREILRIVAVTRGVTMGELRARLALSWAATYHHVEKLERAGEIRLVRAGRRRLVLPVAAPDPEADARARALLRGPTARKIALYVRAHPDALLHEMVGPLAESRRVVYYHVKQLLEAGLLVSASRTRHFGLRGSALLERLLAEEAGSGPRARRPRGADDADAAASP